VQGRDGLLYGMTQGGGRYDGGTIFRMCMDGSYDSLLALRDYYTGRLPTGNLVQGKDSNFYGMMPRGGYGSGTAFKMTPTGKMLFVKIAGSIDFGPSPKGSLVEGRDGNFYGMTFQSAMDSAHGTIFKMTQSGTTTLLKNLYYSTGANPIGSLMQAKDGFFYGMTAGGGTENWGTVFKIDSTGAFKLLVHLNDKTGHSPFGNDLIQGKDGDLYGMTRYGGPKGGGTIFKMTSDGLLTVIKSFDYTTGYSTQGSLVQGSDGTLYGMTNQGGMFDAGTIFRINKDGSGFAVLRHLNPITDGGYPVGSLIILEPNPVAKWLNASTNQNTAKKIKLTASGGSPMNYTLATAPLHGTATIKKDTLIYTPAAGYSGLDSLYYTATWGCQKSSRAKVKITINHTALTSAQVTNTTAIRSNDVKGISKLTVTINPNPSTSYFSLSSRSGMSKPLTVNVIDAVGRSVEIFGQVAPNSTLSFGASYANGTYYAEVLQGSERHVIKLVKAT
jgi:uncharacterized repeat protein (TIGR03803 family)